MSFKLTIGKTSILAKESYHNEGIISIYPFLNINYITRNYLHIFLPYLTNWGNEKKAIKGQTLNSKSLKMMLIPLPPLTEQQRIVEKINNLIPLIEKYNSIDNQNTLLEKEFFNQFGSSIIQYALEGKLVAQNPNDEPASILLKKIKQEKKILIAKKIIKKNENVSFIFKRDNSHYENINGIEKCIDDEIPFKIPDSWEWTRIQDISRIITDGTHKTPKYTDKGIPFLSIQNISSGFFNFTKLKYISLEEHKELIKRILPIKNDILFCRIGTLGKPIKNDLNFEFSIFVSLGLIRLINDNLVDYLILVLKAHYFYSWTQKNKAGGGSHAAKINLNTFRKFLIPLPPLAEQQRIVEKIEKLIQNIKIINQ